MPPILDKAIVRIARGKPIPLRDVCSDLLDTIEQVLENDRLSELDRLKLGFTRNALINAWDVPFIQEHIIMPKILEKAVSKIAGRGVPKDRAYPIAVAALQKAGDLKKGQLTATKKGAKRGAMTEQQRAKTRKE